MFDKIDRMAVGYICRIHVGFKKSGFVSFS